MVSPYLKKPSRSIKSALDDRGMTASDIGLDEEDSDLLASPHPRTDYRYLVAAFACLLLALGAVEISSTLNENYNDAVLTAEDMTKLSDELSEITPAAGD